MAMQYDEQNAFSTVYEILAKNGFPGMAEALQLVLNQGMLIERSQHLHAQPYERTDDRQGFANGFKPKTVKTRIGELHLDIPQVRDSNFYPKALDKGIRSERALKLSLAEMYIQGVSTRKVAPILEQLCGTNISSQQVSDATKLLDAEFEKWRNRKIGEIPYLYLDARYENIRINGEVVTAALLVAIGVTAQGKREILGVSVSYSEHEVHWRNFLESLVARGLHGVTLIISDAHAGLKAARQAVFPTCSWQRCQFHLQQNAQAYVPRKSMKKSVANDIRSIFNAPNLQESQRMLGIVVAKYEKSVPKLSQWIADSITEGLTVFNFPEEHRIKLRTSNLIERINKAIKKRTHVVGIFPNEESCLRLATGVLIEINEAWILEKTYMNMNIEGEE